jgi:hypothetical protein
MADLKHRNVSLSQIDRVYLAGRWKDINGRRFEVNGRKTILFVNFFDCI